LKFAAIDIGSNSIKLVVVDAAAGDSFVVLAREKETVRLGHETLLKGHLGHDAILSAIDCIRRFRSVAEARGAEKIVVIATAAVRAANNSADFINAVEQQTELKVEILSGIEEARLIGLAAWYGCSDKGATTLNIDIGGGSTEISIFRDGQPLSLHSIKLGAVGLTERFFKSDPPGVKAVREVEFEIRAAVEGPARELHDARWDSVTGTSGTILAIGNTLRDWTSNVRIDVRELAQLNASLAEMTVAERRSAARITRARAEIIVAGGLILEGIMRALGIESLTTCEWALREGVIIDRLREWVVSRKGAKEDAKSQSGI
jgi:exopolyphosphatase / guanosine-5'-triphosphate,3'-diphosphate pyrophosphatase